MGPSDVSSFSDYESEKRGVRRGRPSIPRELMLAAADALFARAEAPEAVSMDDVAAAVGVGKGTLFRAFGSRDGLLDALSAALAHAIAALEAGTTRFRPVIMTALAMIIGMIPMALGLGDGGEQNAPLGRAVIGGLLCATVATLVFVPSVFALLNGRSRHPDPQPIGNAENEPLHA